MSGPGKTDLHVLRVLAGFEMSVARSAEHSVLRALTKWRA